MKFCKDCKHYYKIEANMYFGGYQACLFSPGPPFHDPITGKVIRISNGELKDVRQDPTLCGLEGRWHEAGEPLIIK